MALSKDEVIKSTKTLLTRLSRKHNIKQAYLFGSHAKGNPKEYSDIDVAVVLGNARRFNDSVFDEKFQIFHEAQEFNSFFEVVCFDRSEFSGKKSTLANYVKQEGVRIL